MKFLDKLIINVNAGNGGHGCVSFYKNKRNRNWKPNGGNGGDGGNVFLVSNKSINCLSNLSLIKNFFAENGKNGSKNNCSGKKGKDLLINIPLGTKIIDFETNKLVYDIKENNNSYLVAKGGVKGLGNSYFKSSINRSPKNFSLGKFGEKRFIKLKLELFSDVGIFGLVNVGKSSIFKLITEVDNINISSYKFTTIYPRVCKSFVNSYNYFNIIDTPGIIINLNESKKNKIKSKYLNHLNRCKLLLHIIDISIIYNKEINFFKYIKIIDKELNLNLNNNSKNIWIIFNKVDLFYNYNDLNYRISNIFKKYNIKFKYYLISCMNKLYNIKKLKNIIYNFLYNKLINKINI